MVDHLVDMSVVKMVELQENVKADQKVDQTVGKTDALKAVYQVVMKVDLMVENWIDLLAYTKAEQMEFQKVVQMVNYLVESMEELLAAQMVHHSPAPQVDLLEPQ